ncbi:MAG TPA: glycosyltransferase [Acidimicrobiales bacterium]
MLFSIFIICSINLGIAAILLFLLGARVRFASRLVGVLLGAAGAFLAGYVAALWLPLPAAPVEGSEAFVLVCVIAIAILRPVWNPLGQYFFASFVAAALAYLGFAADVTVASNFSFLGSLAAAFLFLLELAALAIGSTFAFETCDVVCRVRHSRVFPTPDPSYQPKVSIHIASYNEPPDMLIQTIKAASQLDYPDFEIVVVDNNTSDPDMWQPVEAYCAENPLVKFVHVDPWPGYKSGALNLALERYVDPRSEIIGVVDSDYLIDDDWLKDTVGYFADPQLAFVQTPQDYREYEGNRYLTACYDAYRYFFASAMPSRNERNSIIFAGTMGLLRRRPLADVGGWDEWCITEDAETSLRLLMAGYSGLYIPKSYGRGIMPLSFSSLKSQRFRWCFGGMQILRRHWKSLLPWDRDPGNRLTAEQRIDYLIGGLQWTNDLILFGFALVLTVVGALLLAGSSVAIRPLIGPTILLPATLLAVGLLRAVWALRNRTRISYTRAVLAFANWLSLSWTVALACIQGLIRREGVFMRTPKSEGDRRLRAAIAAARTELLLTILMWGMAAALAVRGNATWLLIGLLSWQGFVYACAPAMSWLDQHEHLTPELELRRRTESRRERLVAVARPVAIGSLVATSMAGAAFLVVLALGVSHPGHPSNPFATPHPGPGDNGPFGLVSHPASPSNATTTTTTTSGSGSGSGNGSSGTSTTTGSSASSTSTTTGGATSTTGTSNTTTTTIPSSTTTSVATTTSTAAPAG